MPVPGAWEEQRVDLVIGLPHIGSVTMEWVLGLISLEQPYQAYYSFQRGMPIDVARNMVCDKVIELKAKGVFFLDSDVIPPRDALVRLVDHGLPIVSGLYYKKQAGREGDIKGIYVPAMWAKSSNPDAPGKFAAVADFPKGRLVDAEVIGMGACWISRRVLEEWIRCESCGDLMGWKDQSGERLYSCARCKTDPNRVWWFYFSKDRTPAPGEGMSEDFHFCQEARRLGYKIIVDTSILCGHIGHFIVEEGEVRDAHV